MKLIGVLLLLVGQVALAQSQPSSLSTARKTFYQNLESCGQAVWSDANWMVASLNNTANGLGHIRLQSLTDSLKSLDLPAADTVVDVKVQGDTVYVLTETTLEAWSISKATQVFQVPSMAGITKAMPWYDKANGFILSHGRAVIAHGSRGLSIIDLSSRAQAKVIPMPTISSAQDIDALNDSTAVIAVDNASDGEFRGIYVFDLGTLQITKQIKIDNAYPLSIRALPNNILRISYINGVWQFDLQTALSRKEAYPAIRIWQFPGVDDVDMRGKVFYDDSNMYSCFSWVNNYVGGMGMVSGHPMVFSLKDVNLK